MKYPDKELQECLQAFSSYSEDDLIIKMQKTNPECAQHIAAKILLNKKRNKKNRTILIITVLTLIVAALTFAIAVFESSRNRVPSLSNANQMQQQVKPNTELQKTTSKDAAPQQKGLQPMQRQPDPNKTK